MKHWSIPAKTFLIGEYAALKGHPALLLTTQPYFELHEVPLPGLHGIHPDSPAGQWWQRMSIKQFGLEWVDPYAGIGGLGASSAQFLGVYQACMAHFNQAYDHQQLLKDYLSILPPSGIKPSGYDVLAQKIQGCVYLHPATHTYQTYLWPFKDVSYVLIHTGNKLKTHEHLNSLTIHGELEKLSALVIQAKNALETQSSHLFIKSIQSYHLQLQQNGWVSAHTLALIKQFNENLNPLAIKGCGAMGADMILMLVEPSKLAEVIAYTSKKWLTLSAHDLLEFGQNRDLIRAQ